MTPIPTILHLMPIFASEALSIQYLSDKGVFYSKINCLCGGRLSLHGKQYRCTRKICRKWISLLEGSFFSMGRLAVNEAFFIGYLWLINCSHTTILTATGHSPNTVTDYIRYFRQLVVSALDDVDDRIGGPGVVVEVDESKFGKRKYHRGHHIEGAWVIGGVERTEARKFFCVVVEKRDAETIFRVLSRHILPGSILHTDCWRGYLGIDDRLDVDHRTVNHSVGFINHQTNVHTNTVEALWSWLKNVVSLRGRVKEYLPDQLMENIWRRKNADRLWDAFIEALVNVAYS